MAQAGTGTALTKYDLETALIEKCWREPEFRKQVVDDPKRTIEQALGQKLPEQVRIFVHPEDANTLHFAIPPAPANLTELSDEDLEKVAGGTEFVVMAITGALGISAAVGTAVGSIAGAAVLTAKKGW